MNKIFVTGFTYVSRVDLTKKLQKTDVKNDIQVLSSAVKFQLKFCTIFVNKLKTKLIKFRLSEIEICAIFLMLCKFT